jgi:hypothetical protein
VPRLPKAIARNQVEAAFLNLGPGAHDWLVEDAVGGAQRVRSKMADTVELAALMGTDAVNDGLHLAATVARFAEGDLLSMLTFHFAGDYSWNAAECTSLAILNGGCNQEMPLQYAFDRSAHVRSKVAEVAAATEAQVLDLAAQVCSESVCQAMRDGLQVYPDASHISVDMRHSLARAFSAVLTR